MSAISFDLNPKTPEGPLERKWDLHRSRLKLVSPNNKSRKRVIVVGTGLQVARRRLRSRNSVITLMFLLSMTVRDGLTASLHRVGSTRQRTIAMTETACNAFSRTPLKEATSDRAKRMFTGSPRSVMESSISVLLRVCRSHVNMADNWQTVHSAVLKFRARFIVAGKLDSSCCSVRIRL